MSAALPPIEFITEGWELTEAKQRRLINFVSDKMGRYLLDAATKAVQIMKTLTQQHFPPPSQPQEPPRQRTGRLWDSIGIFNITRDEVIFGVDAPYAGFLEYGTVKIQPRPFATPAIHQLIEDFPLILFSELEGELR